MNLRILQRTQRGVGLAPLLLVFALGTVALGSGSAVAAEKGKSEGGGVHGAERGSAHGKDHEFNWFHGFLGESAEDEPGLLWRPPGTPVPFAALLLNYGVLFYLLVRFSRRPLTEALKRRKASLMHGIAEARRMRSDAEEQLKDGQRKLDGIERQIEHVIAESRSAGDLERARLLKEAQEKRTRMERDARVLLQQEMKAAREELHRETVASAVRSAEASLRTRVAPADQERMQREYLRSIGQSLLGGTQDVRQEGT